MKYLYLLLTLITTAYAGLLSTSPGRRFVKARTAESVVLGTSLVLAVLRGLLPSKYWWRVVFAFVFGGSPVILRSLLIRASGDSEI